MGAIKEERIGPVIGGIEVRSSMFAQSLYDVADNDDDIELDFGDDNVVLDIVDCLDVR